ncbi:hypothetical protein [Desulfosporosinus shakirovi]|nr:hypothetical protein [Desulfosporosinus sp. SRJS8]MCB8816541.1 hypothetical protein [Desulfosporosinus sp. SRJS8]
MKKSGEIHKHTKGYTLFFFIDLPITVGSVGLTQFSGSAARIEIGQLK